jgi:AAA+ superfamily predicted ATPase
VVDGSDHGNHAMVTLSFKTIMAKVNEIAKLFQAISDRDWNRAHAIAAKMIAEEERKGNRSAAQTLRGSLTPNGRNGPASYTTFIAEGNQATILSHALALLNQDIGLDQVALRGRWRQELRMLIKEWQNRAILAERGVRRRSKLLFYGPPGCGKSLTGRALGSELTLPTYVVRFDAIIGAYLGQTAIHLRELFRFAEETPCILLLDEADALGKQRGNPLDVGELDRIVIALMQELEHCQVKGFVIATSNLPEHLDRALWRRFDLAIEFPRPSRRELQSYGARIAAKGQTPLSQALRQSIVSAKSYAEAEQLIENEARRVALQDL